MDVGGSEGGEEEPLDEDRSFAFDGSVDRSKEVDMGRMMGVFLGEGIVWPEKSIELQLGSWVGRRGSDLGILKEEDDAFEVWEGDGFGEANEGVALFEEGIPEVETEWMSGSDVFGVGFDAEEVEGDVGGCSSCPTRSQLHRKLDLLHPTRSPSSFFPRYQNTILGIEEEAPVRSVGFGYGDGAVKEGENEF